LFFYIKNVILYVSVFKITGTQYGIGKSVLLRTKEVSIMFGVYFGHYLMGKGVFSPTTYQDLMKALSSVRVKLGLLAIEAGLITDQQASHLNRLQAQSDKRFGSLAMEEGLLTEAQIRDLLKKQGDPYLQFVQIVTDKKLMTQEDITRHLTMYAKENNFSHADIEDLKSGDVDRIYPLFLKSAHLSEDAKQYIGIVIRTLVRFIDPQVRLESVSKTSRYQADFLAKQDLTGDWTAFTGFSGSQEGVLQLATKYAAEEFRTLNEDVLDAACEFLNICNGLFAIWKEKKGEDLDMRFPQMYEQPKVLAVDCLFCAPFYLNGKRLDLLFYRGTQLSGKNLTCK
jgi:hypothetical protein